MHQNTVPIVPSTLAATGIFSPAMVTKKKVKGGDHYVSSNSTDVGSGREQDINTRKEERGERRKELNMFT